MKNEKKPAGKNPAVAAKATATSPKTAVVKKGSTIGIEVKTPAPEAKRTSAAAKSAAAPDAAAKGAAQPAPAKGTAKPAAPPTAGARKGISGKQIIIDCDPGHDDMMAIMLACATERGAASPGLEILGITTVAGNQTGAKTFANALSVLTLIDRTDIPVARGADKPLMRELTIAPTIHGKSGLDGAELPKPSMKARPGHAVDFIADLLKNAGKPVTLIPTGPLTNIALLLMKEPGLAGKIERIVLMGGGLKDSNITPAAEFNIYVDPEAADIVFSSGIPVTMIGLDVTNKAILTFADIEKLGKAGGKITGVVAPLLKFFAQMNKDNFGFAGAPVHDALAVACVIDPTVVKTKPLHVAIETRGELTRGQTVADVYGVTGKKPNADVALELDHKKFVGMLFKALAVLDKQCG